MYRFCGFCRKRGFLNLRCNSAVAIVYFTLWLYYTRWHRKVSGLGEKASFVWTSLNWHLLQNSHLMNIFTNPIVFSFFRKYLWNHSLENCHGEPGILMKCRTQLRNVASFFKFHFNFRNSEKSQGECTRWIG